VALSAKSNHLGRACAAGPHGGNPEVDCGLIVSLTPSDAADAVNRFDPFSCLCQDGGIYAESFR
jgi:hypothetical protein